MELDTLKKLHDKAYNNSEVPREQAADDIVFYNVTQWDDQLLQDSQLSYRGQFDILRKAGRQIMAKIQENPVQVDFKPKDEARQDDANILDGIYRTDDRVNTTIESYTVAVNEAIVCGLGAWELYTEYNSNDPEDRSQVIKRTPIYEANNVLFIDPNARRLDKSDAMYMSILKAYSEDGYKELYKELTGEESNGNYSQNFKYPEHSYSFPWFSQDRKIYVSTFYHREKKTKKIIELSAPDGATFLIEGDDFKEYEDQLMDGDLEVSGEKEVERWEVTRYIASGEEILSEDRIPGENIPVVPIYGERAVIEGVEYWEGITRLSKDPQRLRNFSLSYLADIVSRSPRNKPIYLPEQVQGFEDMYKVTGADNNYPYLLQNMLDGNGNKLPMGPVGEQPEQKIPSALMAVIDQTRLSVEDVANPGLPQNLSDPDLSGKAVMALQNRMDNQSAIYQQNMKHAKRRDGEIYASMAAEIYDSPRQVMLTEADGEQKQVMMMQQVFDPARGEAVVKNNINRMEFDVYSDIGPNYSTVKEQTLDQLQVIYQSVPPDSPLKNAILLKQLEMIDGLSFEDVRRYARRELVLNGFREPSTPEEAQALQQKQQSEQQQVMEAKQLQTQAVMGEAQARMMEGQAEMQKSANQADENRIKQYRAETERQKVMVEAAEAGIDSAKTQAETRSTEIDNSAKASALSAQRQADAVSRLSARGIARLVAGA